ncbi:Ubiquitin carboxyl-terminal hydrolase 2 [Apostasia shenzhenica]|uniref:Ubiquitin carboxyl-terminal hydrolase n=1 Tax=Apostasia shenzhenica TaxID=1088818 RepID=A0A2H9ZVT2_9ASPA|nr:Ubiquitin carboxyl-terminal hydrolase 2 [Apostasia shenzhenica]
MGKKMKKKTPNLRKTHHRGPAGPPKVVPGASSLKIVPCGEGERKTELCNHYSKTVDELNLILIRTRSSDTMACEYCRDEPVTRRGGKEKGKLHRNNGVGKKANLDKSDQNFIWVCLDCGRYFCGGVVSVSEPFGHARRHAKQDHHQWAARADNPTVGWCYACTSSVPVVVPEEVVNGAIVPATNNAGESMRSTVHEALDFEQLKGHRVRGLSNLGNTCFFNSVLQNLFIMDLLRDHLVSLERPHGPLTVALRMLFIETSKQTDGWGVVNPKALFGCICAKAPQFRGYQQQDSHELLRYLLEGLQMEETSARKSEYTDSKEKVGTIVETFFGGQLSSTVSCMECGYNSVVHEPFLDLSLPVPSKKPPSKKSPPPPPKRAKQNLRDRSKSKIFQEKDVSQVSSANGNENAERTSQPSGQSESGIALLQQIHNNALDSQDRTWMDYLGASESADSDDLGAHELGASVMQLPDSKLIDDPERCASCACEFRAPCSSKELSLSSDTGVERTCENELSYSCVQIPGVLPLTCKDQDKDLTVQEINDRTVCSSNTENVGPFYSSVNGYCLNSKSEVAEEFDGFGDLFNEPEVTSDLKTGSNVVEDMGMTLWNDNNCEPNQEEVDNSNAPVSINSCLALFTKPELLTGEQAWYCERCAEISSHQNEELGDINMQIVTISDQSVANKSMVDEGKTTGKSILIDREESSTRRKALDHAKSSSSSENFAVRVEGYCDHYSKENVYQKFSHIGDSQNSGEISNNGTTFSSHLVSNEILQSEIDEGIFGLPLRIDRKTVCGLSNQESTFHATNDQHGIRDFEETPQVAPVSSQFQTNTLESPSKDITRGGNRVRKKDLKSSKVHPAKESKHEGTKMIKRDATKRIRFNHIPPILTIHLKRFCQDSRERLTKLRGHVNFQEMLDLRPYMDQRCMEDECCYRLLGVVEHSGSMGGGHYVAYVRGNRRGDRTPKWFYASDAHVREVSLTEVLQSEAYILFYEKI